MGGMRDALDSFHHQGHKVHKGFKGFYFVTLVPFVFKSSLPFIKIYQGF